MTKLLKLLLLSLIFFTAGYVFPADIFWDNEKVIVTGNINKFSIFSNSVCYGMVYSENDETHKLFLKYTSDGMIWKNSNTIINDFYTENSSGVDFSTYANGNLLYIFYRTGLNKIELYRFDLTKENPAKEKIFEITSNNIIYLPGIFADSNMGLHLFYSENTDKDVRIIHKMISAEGVQSVDNIIGENYKNAINPVIQEYDRVLYSAFQAKDTGIQGGLYYNIILAYSKDFGITWEYKPAVVSNGENNQRPSLLIDKQDIHLVWEKEDENLISHINYKKIDITALTGKSPIDSLSKEISSARSEAHTPYLMKIGGTVYTFWYDNQKNNFQVYFAYQVGNQFTDPVILRQKNGRTVFITPTIRNNLPVITWLQNDNVSTIYYLKTVTDVLPPTAFIRNIREIDGVRYINKKEFLIEWKQDDNPAGIKGYKTLLTKDRNAKIPDGEKLLSNYNLSYNVSKITDGNWFFKIKTFDNAGNESRTSEYNFSVDTTPPPPPEFSEIHFDDNGNLIDNFPDLSWDDKSGNSYIFNLYKKLFIRKDDPEIERIKSTGKMEKYLSVDGKNWKSTEEMGNGLLLFGVQGVDKAGNQSEITWGEFSLANYVVKTVITGVELSYNQGGEKILYVYGKGFKIQGEVINLFIDKNKKEPYDYVFDKKNFTVVSDNVIKANREFQIEDGSYYVGIEHDIRGIVFDTSISAFSSRWMFRYNKENNFSFDGIRYAFREINATFLILLSVVIFWVIIILILIITVINAANERLYVKKLLLKIDRIKEELGEEEYKSRRLVVMKKGLGLTIKYTFLILILVISIVVSTSVAISYLSLGNERKNLANEMKDKALIMMSNYEINLVDIYTLEKGYTEAIDATTLAARAADINFVLFKLAEDNSVLIRYGANRKIIVGGIDMTKMPDKDREKTVLDSVFNEKMNKDFELMKSNYDGNAIIYPEFNSADLKSSYIFAKPVFITVNSQKKFIGQIAIGFSFERIITTIYEESISLFRIAVVVTAIAILLSIIGAIFLATTTIRPIKKISRHVETITTKEDYEELVAEGKDRIEIKTKDEIGILASSINDMTHKLIEKAKADKQLLLGKEIQKKFISLEPFENDMIDVYGYYEGAKGVSGDYFEYKKINDEYYAFIICDVSGKAVPAALIMVQISTIFHSYFATFKIGEDKLDTVEIVNQINDTIEERGFQGRFAAIMVMILNVKTGEGILTNAGYTQVLIYREHIKKCEWVKLFQSGAAGVFPSYMLPDPFKLEKIRITRGDIIFLFTDGIEESRNGKKIKNENGDEIFEEFGGERIMKVIDGTKTKTPKDIIRELMRAENEFRGEMEQYDDLTIMGIQKK